ncbi:uncharacterized protein LOC128042455 [Gossypium raimondii]|uniref:uncharacterized protein LOC128042455 n=1 Tax=Gossypium raimondii TaxID=29730 RepID=UPI00227B6960|nr:uncharacterized protein LOC128042455 [Gossypium raimondii]
MDWVAQRLGLYKYHHDKANVVVDALSGRAMTDLRAMFTRLNLFDDGDLLAELQVENNSTFNFGLNKDGVLYFRGQMYRDLCELYWWLGLKREVIGFVARCLTCQQVKAELQLPSGLLQLVKIPLWKWERVTIDFVSGLPLKPTKKDSIWVIVDRLTKDPCSSSWFWKKLYKALGSRLDNEGDSI